MARHAKQPVKKPVNTEVVAFSVLGAVLALFLAAVILCVNNGVFDSLMAVMFPPSSEPPGTTSTAATTTTTTAERPIEPITVVMPEQVRGVRLVPGVDYAANADATELSVKSEIKAFFNQLTAWEFNTVLLPVTEDGKAYYPSAVLPKAACVIDGFDAVGYILETARQRSVTVMAVLDMSVNNGTVDPVATETVALLDTLAKELSTYRFDVVMLTDYGLAYGAEQNTAAFEAQTAHKTYAAFAEAAITGHINRVAAALRNHNPGGKVGLLSAAVWAHKTVQPDGSSTDGYYEEYTDGYANTREWVKAGLFDLVMVKNYTSTEHGSASFSAVLSWWDALCKAGNTPLYVEQGAHQRDAQNVSGWVSPDQLSLQWLACEKAETWRGSVFSSYHSLQNDEDSAVRVLLETIKGTADVEYISNKLVISEPAKKSITVNQPGYVIRGSADPNFPLLYNGKELETTANHGLFAIEVTLKPGKNTFTFEHKGVKATYTVNYQIDVLTSVSPNNALTLEGGTRVIISAIARKGATVYAMVGNTKVTMQEAPLQSEEGEQESDFINYAGAYTMPAGKDYKTQALGAFTVYASWNGHSEQMGGGKLTVQSNTTTTTTTTTTTGGSSTTTGTTTGQGTSQATAPRDPGVGGTVLAEGELVQIKADYAETFDYDANAHESQVGLDWSRPTLSYLPKYTTDVVKQRIAGSSNCYLLGSGRRVYTADVSAYKSSGKLTANSITSSNAVVTADRTTIQLATSWNVPYNLKVGGQSYPSVGSAGKKQPEYDITDFTATYVDIAFSYTTAVTGSVSVEGSPLFSKAEWIKGNGNVYTLRLHLKTAGEFYGYQVAWMADGSIRFRFRHAAELAGGDKPLTGVTIALDPGHGGKQPGATANIGGKQVLEKTLTLQFANTLKSKLTAMGATVVMSRSADTSITLSEVEAFTRKEQPDLFISIHMNSNDSSKPYGPSVHYFYEQSFDLAKSVYNNALDAYKKASGKTKEYFSTGYKWDPFHVTRVHDCPAVLIECGFMSTPSDLELLITENFRNTFCDGIAAGVVEYLK